MLRSSYEILQDQDWKKENYKIMNLIQNTLSLYLTFWYWQGNDGNIIVVISI